MSVAVADSFLNGANGFPTGLPQLPSASCPCLQNGAASPVNPSGVFGNDDLFSRVAGSGASTNEGRALQALLAVVEKALEFAFRVVSQVIGEKSGGGVLAGASPQTQEQTAPEKGSSSWLDSLVSFGKETKDALLSAIENFSIGDVLALPTRGAGGFFEQIKNLAKKIL